MKKSYYFDFLRVVAALMVVTIHATVYIFKFATFFNYGFYREILELAVPIFFAISGYILSFKIDDKGIAYLKKYLFKVLGIFLSVSMINLATFYVLWLLNSYWINPIRLIDVSSIVDGRWGSYHLWYLWALFICVSILLKSGKFRNYVLILFVLIYGFISIFQIPNPEWILYGGFVKGMNYIAIGFLASKVKVSKSIITRLLIFSFIFYYYSSTIHPNRFSDMFMMVLIFAVIQINNIDSISGIFEKITERYLSRIDTSGVYYYHMMALSIINGIYPLLSIRHHFFPYSVILGITLVVLMSMIICRCIEPIRGQIVDWLAKSFVNGTSS